jgi:hypothetical protein
MKKTEACIWLSPGDRATLEGWVSGRNTPQKVLSQNCALVPAAHMIVGNLTVRRLSVVDFKGSHFEREIILWGVRWYVAYPIS